MSAISQPFLLNSEFMKLVPVLLVCLPLFSCAQNTLGREEVERQVRETLKPVIEKNAAWAMQQQPVTVTASSSPRSAGGKHDFFSEGDYWWPDPANPDGPYVQRDGMTNPDNFTEHRKAMIRFSRIAGALGSAYVLTEDKKYADQLAEHCSAWFMDTATRMNPNLLYAQAIKGRATGRGIGIIDAIQLMEVARALEKSANDIDPAVMRASRTWFGEYLNWVTTHPYGIDEMNAKNNHGTCWVMQVSVFARFSGRDDLVESCRARFRDVLLPGQLAADGSFPLELKRTKPYGYSLFNLDAMVTTAWILSGEEAKPFTYKGKDADLNAAATFMYPFVKNKNSWPYPKDVMYWDNWPVAHPFLVFSAVVSGKKEYLDTWKLLDHDPQVDEVIRNLPVRNPLIWF